MTLEQLQAEAVSLARQLAPLQTRHRAAHKLIEQRKREAAARARILVMPAAEKEALFSVLSQDADVVKVAEAEPVAVAK